MNEYLTVWDCEGDHFRVDADEEPRIDAAVSEYIASSGSRDSILDLELVDGRLFKVLASQITSWAISTPETRRRGVELEAEDRAESEELKKAFGLWEQT